MASAGPKGRREGGGGTGEARRGRAPHGVVPRVFLGVEGANLGREFLPRKGSNGGLGVGESCEKGAVGGV